jgi:hypothetical protein
MTCMSLTLTILAQRIVKQVQRNMITSSCMVHNHSMILDEPKSMLKWSALEENIIYCMCK